MTAIFSVFGCAPGAATAAMLHCSLAARVSLDQVEHLAASKKLRRREMHYHRCLINAQLARMLALRAVTPSGNGKLNAELAGFRRKAAATLSVRSRGILEAPRKCHAVVCTIDGGGCALRKSNV